MSRTIRHVSALLAFALVASACGSSSSDEPDAAPDATEPATAEPDDAGENSFPLTLDNCGAELVLDEAPETVMTIGAAALELVHAAGAADRVVARAGEFGTVHPPEIEAAYADVEILTDFDPGLEPILGTGADLVIGYGLFETTPEALAENGVDHLAVTAFCGSDAGGEQVDQNPLELAPVDIRTYGTIFGTEDVADAAADDYEARLAAIEPISDGETVAAIYWFGADPSAFAQGSVVDAIFDELGLVNVFGDTGPAFIELNLEALLDADPDVIVLVHGISPEFDEAETDRLFAALPGAEDLQAVTGDRVLRVDGAFADSKPSALDGMELLAEEIPNL